jgi:cytochrome c peroxidase
MSFRLVLSSRRRLAAAGIAVVAGAAVAAVATQRAALVSAPPVAVTQFDVTGFLQAATVEAASDPTSGGTLTVNGQQIVVPRNLVVVMPGALLTWQQLFAMAPPPYGPGQTGLAMADSPAPFAPYEIHVVGNRVAQGGSDRHIAGLVYLSQKAPTQGQGYVNFVDYAAGELRVGGALGDASSGQRVRLNDPQGRYGRASSSDPRFAADPENPMVRAGTGFPMCIPRVAPTAATPDALCPESNRPKDPSGAYSPIFTMPAAASVVPGGPDPMVAAPFEVGDYVTYSGALVRDGAQPTVGPPPPSVAGSYVSAWQVVANVGIATSPGTDPVFVSVDVSLLGTGGVSTADVEATVRTRFEGMTTDPFRLDMTDFSCFDPVFKKISGAGCSVVELYGIDVDPCTGAPTDRPWGAIDVDPGPPNGAVTGRWRFRPPNPSIPLGGSDGITFIPPTRRVHAIVRGATPTTTKNGFVAGQYSAPISEFLFPENVGAGTPIVANNLETFPFLANGSGPVAGPGRGGPVLGQLSPWPGAAAPAPNPPTCATPQVGQPFSQPSVAQAVVAPGAAVTLLGGGFDPGGLALAFDWTAPAGITLSDPKAQNPTFTAPATAGALVFTLVVTNSAGVASLPAGLTVNVQGPTPTQGPPGQPGQPPGVIDPPSPVPLPTDPAGIRTLASHVTGTLKGVTAPRPADYATYVKDQGALLKLGKALFWDTQLGSDGLACASCHYHAGADGRSKNQLDPGLRNETAQFPTGDAAFANSPLQPSSLPPFAPNYQLVAADFPLHRLSDPTDRHSTLLSDTNDVVSSQGVFNGTFTGKRDGNGVELTPTGPGAIFQVNGVQVRNVEPRNVPSVVNAVFNHRNFWDERARSEFNGTEPIGQLDPGATVVRAGAGPGGAPALVAIAPDHMSLASQADGPPLSNLEMAFTGKNFSDLGRKMLAPNLAPLGLQQVSAQDSVLGALAKKGKGATGLGTTYTALVQQAFQPSWWDAAGYVIDFSGAAPLVKPAPKKGNPSATAYTIMEVNFPLYFGFAIAEYERSLVSDDTPFDRFMAGDDTALTPEQQRGLGLFVTKGRCVNCHAGAELTSASIANIQRDGPMERMITGDGHVAVYDTGTYNIGVRLTHEDIGVGGSIGPQNLPLSDSRRYQACVKTHVAAGETVLAANRSCGVPPIRARPAEAQLLLDQALGLVGRPPDVAGLLDGARGILTAAGPDLRGAFGVAAPTAQDLAVAFADQRAALEALGLEAKGVAPDVATQVAALLGVAVNMMPDAANGGDADAFNPIGPPLGPDEKIVADGTFKVPSLRNVELTAPYFHNGGQLTLEQVVQFYDRGGDFADDNRADLDTDIAPIGFSADDKAALVAFLHGLTDERVRNERAPFDHPSLVLPNGASMAKSVKIAPGQKAAEDLVTLPAVGAAGSPTPLGTAHTPFANFLDPLN